MGTRYTKTNKVQYNMYQKGISNNLSHCTVGDYASILFQHSIPKNVKGTNTGLKFQKKSNDGRLSSQNWFT